METTFPFKQRFRANSIIEKAQTRSSLPLRFLQCASVCGLLYLAYHSFYYTEWTHCSSNKDYTSSMFCSTLYQSAPPDSHLFLHDDSYISSAISKNTSYATYNSHSPSPNKTPSHDTFNDEEISTLDLDLNDFNLPSNIGMSAESTNLGQPYFKQSKQDGHRAAGYGNETDLTDAPYVRASLLRHLLLSLDAFAIETDFIFWLSHGTLLGQYWGEKIMAEDTDVDVQTSIGALHRVRSHAGKLFRDRFQLNINPHYTIRNSANKTPQDRIEMNTIDARWVDTLSGHFIDITALATPTSFSSFDNNNKVKGGENSIDTLMLQDKSIHYIKYSSLSPLTRCQFEDSLFWCPADSNTILLDEYPNYKNPHHDTWRFNSKRKIFERITCERLLKMYTFPSIDDCDQECKEVVANERILGWIYLVVPWEHHNQCQLEIKWTDSATGQQITRLYRGIHQGEDPAKRITSNHIDPVDWNVTTTREG